MALDTHGATYPRFSIFAKPTVGQIVYVMTTQDGEGRIDKLFVKR